MRSRWLWLGICLLSGVGASGWLSGVIPTRASTPEATCTVYGFVNSDTTWSPTVCDPYVITGSLVVNSGVTLTIESGATLRFDPALALTVNGALIARGTVTNPITFTANLTDVAHPFYWGYVLFSPNSQDAQTDNDGQYLGGSALEYTLIEYAGGSNPAENGAVRLHAASPYLQNNLLHYNAADAIHAWNDGGTFIAHNTIISNGVTGSAIRANGIYVAGADATNAQFKILTNTILSNTGAGILLASFATSGSSRSQFWVEDNTVMNNDNGGLSLSSNSASSVGASQFVARYNRIIRNRATASGGGISLKQGRVGDNFQLFANLILSNTSQGNGGGLALCNGCVPVMHYNHLYSNTASLNGIALYNGNFSGNPDVDAVGNYWGHSTPTTIENRVWHYWDDASLGLVNLDPYCLTPCYPPEPVYLPVLYQNYSAYFIGPFEAEPNNTASQANGFLAPGVSYLGYPNDTIDLYKFQLTSQGQITVALTLPIGYTGRDTQLQLFYQTTGNRVGYSASVPYRIVCPQGACTGAAGLYYVFIYTASGFGSTTPYTLSVDYP